MLRFMARWFLRVSCSSEPDTDREGAISIGETVPSEFLRNSQSYRESVVESTRSTLLHFAKF